MDPNRAYWNQQQQALRQALTKGEDHQLALDLFMDQHAMLHSAEVSGSNLHSFADDLWLNLGLDSIRLVPRGFEHSIAWNIWHLARIEDVTMNMLLAGGVQLAEEEHWLERMKSSPRDTGNALDAQGIAALSAALDIPVLRAYRDAVGRRTRELVRQLEPGHIHQKVQPERLQQVLATGAVVEQARGLIDYWGGLTIAGLLLMPPTRHNFIHLNEALRIKAKIR